METVGNHDLQLAYDFVRYTNRNIFLTGKAGTGKTTFLRDLKLSSHKRLVVVAPTGVAAINAGGVTIHSFFQLPFHPFIPEFYMPDAGIPGKENRNDPAGYKMSREKINIIRSLDLLIIDEISMVRADILDAIDSALRRYKMRNLPFGGVQLLMIGDLQQLAPVVRDEEREILGKYYESFFFFGSKALRNSDYVTIELKHIYRQSDQDFIELLNSIRENHVNNEVLNRLNERYIPDFDPDSGGGYITLTTHNNQARLINESKLRKLPGPEHSFSAVVRDEFPELSYPNDSELVLKKGAQVMFIKNDISGEKLFFNGKIGKVISFEEDVIVVMCPGDDSPIMVNMAEWQNMKYSLNEETRDIEETVIGTFTQYPLRLAWAITIHKSQGLTFERAVIDASAAFAHGQVYVALSRCRSLNGLVLSSRISQRSIIDNQYISEFINDSVKNQPGQSQLAESKKAFGRQLLSELFDFSSLAHRLSYAHKTVNEHREAILGDLPELLEKAVSAVRTELTDVSEKFQPQLRGLLNREQDPESNTALQDRVKKAAAFFSVKLEEAMKPVMEGSRVETDNREVHRSVTGAIELARKESLIKAACLNAVISGFDVGSYLSARAKASVELPEHKSRAAKQEDETSGAVQNPALFSTLKKWRNDRARETGLPGYRILHQKTLAALAKNLPASVPALLMIKGMGRRKADKYGEEILEIIASYCRNENIKPPAGTADGTTIQKKKKEDTKKITYDLFRSGKSVPTIAAERKLTVNTIENHLAHYVNNGKIELGELVAKEKADLIAGHFKGKDDFSMGPVKEALGDAITWSEIRFVISHLLYLRKSDTDKSEKPVP